MLKPKKGLRFINVVEVNKPHFIFKQQNFYYTMTTTDKGTRGNMFIYRTSELNTIRRGLMKNNIPNKFHYEDIFTKIKHKLNDSFIEEYEHRLSRLLNACYVLAGLGYLTVFKEGRKVYCLKTPQLKSGEKIYGKKKKRKIR